MGYETGFFGKWHVSAHHGGYLGWSPDHGPRQQGFATATEDFGSHPYSYKKDGKPAPVEVAGHFPPDSMTGHAIAFLEKKREAPFFLMVSHFYVHTPVKSPCLWLLEEVGKRVPPDSPNRENRIVYGAFVETLDHYVGQLLAALDEAGLRENTLVVFTSDNGGHPQYASNGPLRGSKWNLYEGGIRVPFLARWPGQIPAGSICATPVAGYDLLPTFAETAGAESGPIDGMSLRPLFSDPAKMVERDMIWHFPYYHPETGFNKALNQIGIDDFEVSKTRPQAAIRRGTNKLIRFFEDDRHEFYDLEKDPGEQCDLSASEPEAARRLALRLQQALDQSKARMPTAREPRSQ